MKVTIKDIAERAGLSPATVSRAINGTGYVSDANRRKINEIINELNYVPNALAKGLSSNSTNIIGVMLPEIDNPFFSGIIKGIGSVADDLGFSIILCNTDENVEKEKRMLQVLRSHRVRGLLLAATANSGEQERDYAKRFESLGVPIVLIDREIMNTNFDTVLFDDQKALCDLTTLLLNEGHRHIFMLAGNVDLDLGMQRVNGYRKAYRNMRLEYNRDWICQGSFTKDFAYQAVKELLSKDRSEWPTAIIANNNMLSLGALKAIYEMDLRIPEDIAFGGYDQIEELEIFKINITLVEKDTRDMGRQAMKMLYERINSVNGPGAETGDTHYKLVKPARLVIRGSEKLPEWARLAK